MNEYHLLNYNLLLNYSITNNLNFQFGPRISWGNNICYGSVNIGLSYQINKDNNISFNPGIKTSLINKDILIDGVFTINLNYFKSQGKTTRPVIPLPSVPYPPNYSLPAFDSISSKTKPQFEDPIDKSLSDEKENISLKIDSISIKYLTANNEKVDNIVLGKITRYVIKLCTPNASGIEKNRTVCDHHILLQKNQIIGYDTLSLQISLNTTNTEPDSSILYFEQDQVVKAISLKNKVYTINLTSESDFVFSSKRAVFYYFDLFRNGVKFRSDTNQLNIAIKKFEIDSSQKFVCWGFFNSDSLRPIDFLLLEEMEKEINNPNLLRYTCIYNDNLDLFNHKIYDAIISRIRLTFSNKKILNTLLNSKPIYLPSEMNPFKLKPTVIFFYQKSH